MCKFLRLKHFKTPRGHLIRAKFQVVCGNFGEKTYFLTNTRNIPNLLYKIGIYILTVYTLLQILHTQHPNAQNMFGFAAGYDIFAARQNNPKDRRTGLCFLMKGSE